MVKTVIFDFDLTLFDSSEIKYLMDQRKWSQIYKNIDKYSFYPFAISTLSKLRENNINIAIVSNAPSSYVKRILTYFSIKIDFIVCYHDVKKHKPNPEGVYKVVNYFKNKNHEVLYIGDNDIDYNTAYNANIKFYGVPWGEFSYETNIINYNSFIDCIIEH